MAPRLVWLLGVVVSVVCVPVSGDVAAQGQSRLDSDKARVIEYWTGERRATAIPRDLVIDPRGLGYLRRPDGSLVPHGHNIVAEAPSRAQSPSPFAKPGGGSGDTTPPTINTLDPIAGATIGASYTFSASVTDASGVKSVSFKLQKVGSIVQSFTPTKTGTDTWSVALQGFTDGDWTWWVEAKDGAGRGGNSGSSPLVNFQVSTGGSGGGGGGSGTDGTVTNAEWTSGGTVQTAAGRLYFEMPANRKRTQWWGYVCSGTVVTDDTAGRSMILTAAHCVYDDVNKAFARNVMFIPDQDGTTGSATDRNCNNDPLGCWVPSFGVVDNNWALRTFPDNIPWDYAFYVVSDSAGSHQGNGADSALETVAGSLAINFNLPDVDDGISGPSSLDFTYALGYSYSEDPNFMYCAEDMTTEGAFNWWLPSCALSGGSSGGPWVQPMNTQTGNGDIISVNSWGYTDRPGMAGPKLVGTSAACIFNIARSALLPQSTLPDGEAGTTVTSCP